MQLVSWNANWKLRIHLLKMASTSGIVVNLAAERADIRVESYEYDERGLL